MRIYKQRLALYLSSYTISKQALSFIEIESQQKFPNETGGILIGWQDKSNNLRIEVAIGPGPNAIHTTNNFQRDGLFAQKHLDEITNSSAGKWDYVGEWHSHPQNVGPSQKDVESLEKIMLNQYYAIDNPVLGLSIMEENRWNFSCFSLLERKTG